MANTDEQNDGLSVAFPLPYRVLVLIAVGLLGWATNIHLLHRLDIDVVAAMDLKTEGYPLRLPVTNHRRPSLVGHHGHAIGHARSLTYTATPFVYQSLYRTFLAYSGICFISWTLYRLATQNNPLLADTYGYIPAFTAVIMVGLLVSPYNHFFKEERDKFTQSIRRCFLSSTNTPILFSDVILADVGTSFAKVIGDVWLSICMIFPGNSMLNSPPQIGLARWIVPSLMSLPYLARFRQCVIEYNLPSNESTRPLFNAIKYATAFPVIYLSAAQGLILTDPTEESDNQDDPWRGEHRLFRLWLLAVFVNSIYSFWWDITNDWGLELLKIDSSAPQGRQPPKTLILPRIPLRRYSSTPLIDRTSSGLSSSSGETTKSYHVTESKDHIERLPYGLRRILLFPLVIYPLLIIINFVLRMTWTVKLATHLHATRDGSITIFGLELAEILRRWLWVFIRVEWEVIKKLSEEETKEEPNLLDLSSRESSVSLEGTTTPPPNLFD